MLAVANTVLWLSCREDFSPTCPAAGFFHSRELFAKAAIGARRLLAPNQAALA